MVVMVAQKHECHLNNGKYGDFITIFKNQGEMVIKLHNFLFVLSQPNMKKKQKKFMENSPGKHWAQEKVMVFFS